MEFVGSHGDSENAEQMKETKRDIENKVGKILKLIQNNGQARKGKFPEDSKKRSALIELVEDFHKQYQSLYVQYDHLRAETENKDHGRKEKGSSSSSSFSESEYYSPDDISSSPVINMHLETPDGTAGGELDVADIEITGLKHRLASATAENEALRVKYSAALQEADTANQQNNELTGLIKVLELHESQAPTQMKELEGQLSKLKTEMDSLYSLRKDLESQIENKAAEAKQLQEKNSELLSRVSELELVSKEKGDEISKFQKQMKENEKNFKARIEDLLTQVNNLQLETVSLRSQNGKLEASKRKEASAQAKGLKNRINVLQKELETLRNEKSKLVLQLNMKTKEVADNLLRTETLEGDLAKKTITEQELLKEKEAFLLQREELGLEANSLRNQKNRLEELIRGKNQEADHLREEGERMHARIFEMEGFLLDRGDSFSPCQKEYESRDNNEASSQIMALKSQVFSLQQDLDSLQSEKSLLDSQNERLRRDAMQIQFQMENEIHSLTSKIEDQQKILKEKEDTVKKLTEESKVARHHLLDSPKYRSLDSPKYRSLESPKPQSLERKMEELSENFNMKMENHIRILYQRILVAEQIHAETKDAYKKMKEKLDQENMELSEKTAAFKAELRKIKEMLSEPGEEDVFSGAEAMLKKFDEENANLSDPICQISNELQFVKRWIMGTKDEIKKLKHNVDNLTLQLNGKEEKELMLREKVWKLEAKLSKEGGDKLNSVSQLERKVVYLEQQTKDKEEVLLCLSEEKREAIRQLCLLIDYHRGRYDHLREVISNKTTARIKKIS